MRGDARSNLAVFWAVFLAMLVLPCGRYASAGEPAGDPAAARFQAAPDFSRPDLNQRNVSLSAFRGKVVLLNFWATWCGPCLAEVPKFAQWQHAYASRGLRIVGVSMDDQVAPVQAAYRKYHLNYPVVMGDARLAELYGGVYGLPLSFVIDRAGQIRYRQQGEADLDDLEREIKTLLAQR